MRGTQAGVTGLRSIKPESKDPSNWQRDRKEADDASTVGRRQYQRGQGEHQ